MSAFAAFLSNDRPKSSYKIPKRNKSLLNELVSCSNLSLTPQNSILTNTSIFLGIRDENHIVVNGSYELRVLRGACLINNVHHIEQDETHRIIAANFRSSPVICASLSRSEIRGHQTLLPDFDTVIELRNLKTGLEELGNYFSKLNELYYTPKSSYTFKVVTEDSETLLGVHHDAASIKLLDTLSQALSTKTENPGSVLVFGANNCGKTTFAKALCDNVVLATGKSIAYMDLDPSRSEDSVPGCLSLTLWKKPNFGVSFPKSTAFSEDDDLQCYYGFNSPLSLPERYFQCFQLLLNHYLEFLFPKMIPLVINTPGWIRGFGKELLGSILENTSPSHLVYFSHNNALHVDDYEADVFEAQDNPDDEVLSGLSFSKMTTLRGVRRASVYNQSSIQQHDLMAYFHRRGENTFDFSTHLLSTAPLKLFYQKNVCTDSHFTGVSGVCVFGHDLDKDVHPDDIKLLVDSCVMALCLVDAELIPKDVSAECKNTELKDLPRYINSSSLSLVNLRFVSLCIIHSIHTKDGYFNVYLPPNDHKIAETILARSNTKLLLVRGEGEIPMAEMMHPKLIERKMPYVNYETKSKIGGVWKVRHNIKRKNQK